MVKPVAGYRPLAYSSPEAVQTTGTVAEELLAERGLDVSYETVRRWVLKFGPLIARKLRQGRPRPSARGRADAKAKDVKFGRKPTLTSHQQREARGRIAAGETQRGVARSYN